MFWRSVVFKLWFTIILMVAFVLFILTVLLLEFFENYYVEEAEKNLLNQAESVATLIESHGEDNLQIQTINEVTAPTTRVIIFYSEHEYWMNDNSESNPLPEVEPTWFLTNTDLHQTITDQNEIMKIAPLPNSESKVVLVGIPFDLKGNQGAIYAYQSLAVIEETTTKTTRIILIAASISIILTTIFAFFLSTRITAPLIKMRKAAGELSRGEFYTKVPVLTHDEIGELAISFNRMRRQLNDHISALNQEKSHLSSILKSMADGVITINKKYEIMVMNPPAKSVLEQLGYQFDDKVNKIPAELQGYFENVLEEEQESVSEISVQGRTYVLLLTPLYTNGVIRGVVAILRDMTEERQTDKLRKDFLANVSHELRTPISLMQGYSEAIVDDIAASNEEKRELAQIIYDESLRMSRLVNELLDLARMEAGHIQLNLEKVEIGDYVNRVAKKFRTVAADQNIHLDLSLNNQTELVFLDPDRMEQVLTNLIDNAIRHSASGDSITITLDELSNEFIIYVKDEGSGIPEEDVPFIFERFYKSDKARTRKKEVKGTGLGLSIAKHIVEAHKGRISVQSHENEGTKFTITLPKNPNKDYS